MMSLSTIKVGTCSLTEPLPTVSSAYLCLICLANHMHTDPNLADKELLDAEISVNGTKILNGGM